MVVDVAWRTGPRQLTNTEFPFVCLCVSPCFPDQTLVLSGLVTHAALSLSLNQARGVPLVITFQHDNGIQSQPRASEPLFLLGVVLALHVLLAPKNISVGMPLDQTSIFWPCGALLAKFVLSNILLCMSGTHWTPGEVSRRHCKTDKVAFRRLAEA